jgi:hypothetical protein
MIHVPHWCDKPVTCLYLHLMHLYHFLSTNLDLIPRVLILNAPFITLGPFAHLIPQKKTLPLKEFMLMNPTNPRQEDDKVLNKSTSTISWFLHKQIFRQFETG